MAAIANAFNPEKGAEVIQVEAPRLPDEDTAEPLFFEKVSKKVARRWS